MRYEECLQNWGNASSFWRKDKYLIVIGAQTSHSELGHELRHCFQGTFH